MKIAILTSSFPRYLGDYQGNFIYYLARGQVERGNDVFVICPHIPGTPFHEIMEGIEIHRFPYFYPYSFQRLSSDTGMYSALRHSLFALIQIPLFFLCQWYSADRIIRKNTIDIIHSHWIIPQGLTGYLCSKIRKRPLVISSHVADAQVISKWRVLVPVLRLILSGTSFLTTNSTFTKKVIGDLGPIPCPCQVIPMGVVPVYQVTRKNDVADDPHILFVGRLIEWKGVDTLIRAMVQVRKEKTRAVLSIVGDGPERTRLENLANELGIREHVHFLGRVEDSELSNLYSCASVFVLPSQSSRGMVMEGLGVVLLEAMSNGIPVIGSDIGGIPDIIVDGETGFLVPEQDPAALAEKVVRVLSDEDLREKFRENGYIRIQEFFSWEKISEQFFTVYSAVISKKIQSGDNP